MKNDLSDVETYHQELLYTIEFRRRLKAKRQNAVSALATLDHVDPMEDEDKEFAKSYIQSCYTSHQQR